MKKINRLLSGNPNVKAFSMANQCSYCATHHSSALNQYWKNSEKLQLLKTDFHSLDLSVKELGLCEFARLLTL